MFKLRLGLTQRYWPKACLSALDWYIVYPTIMVKYLRLRPHAPRKSAEKGAGGHPDRAWPWLPLNARHVGET